MGHGALTSEEKTFYLEIKFPDNFILVPEQQL